MRKMNDEQWFFIYLLEHYADYKQRPTGEVLKEWNRKGITEEIHNGFFQYHQEALKYAYMDIDSLMETGKHKIFAPGE